MEHWKNLSLENLKEYIEEIGWVEEEWRPIKDFEGKYQISSFGRVKSLQRLVETKCGSLALRKQKIRKQRILDGYPKLSLTKEGKPHSFFVHRLVATAFIPPVKGKKFVNHKKGIRTYNIFTNLEWMTTSENVKHGYHVNGRINPLKGKSGNASKRAKPVILTNRFTGQELYFESGHLAILSLNLTSGSLPRVLNGKYKYTKDWHARFA